MESKRLFFRGSVDCMLLMCFSYCCMRNVFDDFGHAGSNLPKLPETCLFS